MQVVGGGHALAADAENLDGVIYDSVEPVVAEAVLQILQLVRETLSSFAQTLSNAEQEKLRRVQENLDRFLEQMEAAKKANKLKSIFRALGILGLIISFIAAIFVPNPATISMLVIAVVLTFEPIIAEAAGKSSIIEKLMAALMDELSEIFGPALAAVFTALIIVLLIVALTAAASSTVGFASRGFSFFQTSSQQLGSQTANSTDELVTTSLLPSGKDGKVLSSAIPAAPRVQPAVSPSASNTFNEAARQVTEDLLQVLGKFKSVLVKKFDLTPRQEAALSKFLDATQSAILVAQGGTQIHGAALMYEAAKLMHEFEMEKADIDLWTSLIDLLSRDTDFQKQFLLNLKILLNQVFV